MATSIPTDLNNLYFPNDPLARGAAPRGAQLDAMRSPWALRQIHEAGDVAMMELFDRGARKLLQPLANQLDDPALLNVVLQRHREEFYTRRNGAPLSELHLAILSEDTDLARSLLQSGAPETSTLPALHAAAFEGNAKMVDALTSAGAQVNARDAQGRTAAIIASSACNAEALGALLSRGADPRIQDNEGKSALMLAIHGAALECIEMLLPASEVGATDKNGRSAVDYVPFIHVDSDDPHFEDVTRYLQLVESMRERREFEGVSKPGSVMEKRSL